MNEEFTRFCQNCNREFPERQLQESHDIPTYLFPGNKRNERKQYADKKGRHYLCKKCHDDYEWQVLSKCLKYLGEDIGPHTYDEKHLWMREISKLRENLKKQLRKIAEEVKREWYGENE